MSVKRILIAPLDWGLGHATRCIPIIRCISDLGHIPVIASDGRPGALLRSEFPELEHVQLRGYEIEYPTGAGMAWKMFRSTPKILSTIKWEHEMLPQLIKEHRIDGVISDNRFGLYSELVPCVYVTHQVMIKAPLFENRLHRMHMNYARKFSQCWVPDVAERGGLSGDLGHRFPLPENGRFIGPLSRFTQVEVQKSLDLICVISGPEPQRTRFENILLSQLEKFEGTAMLVRGVPDSHADAMNAKGHRLVNHLGAVDLQRAMASAKVVLSRSGYSTIMDLSVIGGKAIFVPTPGQTEQEYLARKFDAEGLHLNVKQSELNLISDILKAEKLVGFQPASNAGYRKAVMDLVELL